MFVRADGAVVTSASDLTVASQCEFAFVRTLDAKLGRIEALAVPDDPMLVRAGALGDVHERHQLDAYRAEFGPGVVEIERPDVRDAQQVTDAVAATLAGFAAGAPVVFQATFASETAPAGVGRTGALSPFIGFADFIVRQPSGRYRVQDTKLARRAKVTALLQLAAYHEQLERNGVPVDDTVELLLGDGTTSAHSVADIAPVYRRRKARLDAIVAERLAEPTATAAPWLDPRYAADGHCDFCAAELEAARDLFLVAGMRGTQRAHLLGAGIRTIDELAELPSSAAVEGITTTGLASLRLQARAQLARAVGAPPPVEVFSAAELGAIPVPDEGDVFFDFEGDPLYAEPRPGGGGAAGAGTEWGIDYLFGLCGPDEGFRAFWAHDLREERRALLDFLAFIRERRQRHPRLHIYHYAAYERTHLLSIAARHGVGEADVDDLLRDDVLVDLYPIVRKALRIGTRSYSIKKLEPIYMGDELRDEEGVTSAVASIEQYVAFRAARDAGADAVAERLLAEIADYNRYDVVSTHRLRDWMLSLAAERGVAPGSLDDYDPDEVARDEPSETAQALAVLAGEPFRERSADEAAYALASAAIDYHRRENKAFWWAHYSRLADPIDDWANTRDVLRVERAEVLDDWHVPPRARLAARRLRLAGEWAPGSRVSNEPFAVYDHPGPFRVRGAKPGSRPYRGVRVVEELADGSVIVDETCPPDVQPWRTVPVALTPASPPRADKLVAAIESWGQSLIDAAPAFPLGPVTDLLRRTPPRTRSGALAPLASPDASVDALVASLLDLDRSYLAVQGPPGTGKTYVAAHVIRRLVAEHGWRVGVVAQSHAVVEHVLERVVAAGLDPDLVGKSTADATARFTVLERDGYAIFQAQRAARGYVVGGTAWDLTNPARVRPGSLDLLVIDEAGQFSIANTIAVASAARNLLLFGDPQQLPQVSQGIHPAPVDGSALGFVSDEHRVLPPELGYFLAESRRMHTAVTAPVSRLAYEGALRAHPCTATRSLEGVTPGLQAVPVPHEGRSTESPEEADAVVGLALALIGTPWSDPTLDPPRVREPLGPADVIVVTPYNAQVALLRDALDAVGLTGVQVGTVDKFQGREAVVSITSLAASSAADVPRGMDFLINRNRLNVAISRAQWAAFLVYSPGLAEHLPHRPEQVAELSAFLTLVDPV
ncbi:TM0106 family RecB-like putative nuclease [Galbitalea sp. SE-J8]|uniref:TM0106 family RecB-like putative nuclease n=1 Tax=Galbitalea sp. SE-J8 TaxID=3054952 RepID=UPI00259C7A6B|nr:bifunctional RecB family nuclease/DEAD/DEAH box helicase [Galbitalea sp. SE-J8]MDM4762912.1 TM0106 family RecB-like putative nuclease [Galbitalea sp. SE-J8]